MGKNQQKKMSKQQKILCIIIAAVVVLGIIAAIVIPKVNAANRAAKAMEATDYVAIDIADYGTITAELYGNTAPITVANFTKLAGEGFYDGLTFHRIISGFMIQGGDPLGNGTGGSDANIRGEFSANGVENNIAHERGVISMARSSMPDSASSQFFIMHEAAPHLDGSYAAFGRVLSGLEIVDQICEDTTVQDPNGTVLAADQPVITAIRIIEKP